MSKDEKGENVNQIAPTQTLIENWEVKFERGPRYGKHRCHIYLTHPLIVTSSGEGNSIEAARMDAIMRMATGYVDHMHTADEGDLEWAISDETLDHLFSVVNRERNRRRKNQKSKLDA